MSSYRLAVVALSLLGSGACASTPTTTTHSSDAKSRSVAPASRPRYIQVRNQHPLDVAVYLLRGGTRFRIGTVTALSDGVLRLPISAHVDGSVRLLIDPIGGGQVYVTDALIVGGDQQVEVTVARIIQMSTMSIWTRR